MASHEVKGKLRVRIGNSFRILSGIVIEKPGEPGGSQDLLKRYEVRFKRETRKGEYETH